MNGGIKELFLSRIRHFVPLFSNVQRVCQDNRKFRTVAVLHDNLIGIAQNSDFLKVFIWVFSGIKD